MRAFTPYPDISIFRPLITDHWPLTVAELTGFEPAIS